jgi:urease accessory protein
MTAPTPPASLDVSRHIEGGRGLSAVLLRRAASIALPSAVRASLRFEAPDSTGRSLRVTLAEGTRLRTGDVLVGADGSLVRLDAAAEPVLVVVPCPEHGGPADLLRAAWWLGDRHVPVQVHADRLELASDPGLAQALRARHLVVTEISAPFEAIEAMPRPHGQASDAARGHDHDHGHDHSHDHGQDHAHGHGHGHSHDHGQDHAHGHGHGHDDGPHRPAHDHDPGRRRG